MTLPVTKDDPKVEDPKGDPTPTPKTFTQEQVNQLTGKARAEERAKYPGYESLKDKLAAIEESNLSETERKDKELAEAVQTASEASTRISDVMINADIKVQAAQRGLVDVDAALALVDRSGLSYADDAVSGTSEALDSLVEARPWLKGSGKPVAPVVDAKGTPAPASTMTPAQREMSHKMFGPSAEAEAQYQQGIPKS